MWHEDNGKAVLVDPEGQVHRLLPIFPKKSNIKYASSTNKPADSDKIKVDFHIDATYSNRIPKRVSIVTDSNWKDFLIQEKQKRQRKDDERFQKEVEDMRASKRLNVLQESYRNRGLVI